MGSIMRALGFRGFQLSRLGLKALGGWWYLHLEFDGLITGT